MLVGLESEAEIHRLVLNAVANHLQSADVKKRPCLGHGLKEPLHRDRHNRVSEGWSGEDADFANLLRLDVLDAGLERRMGEKDRLGTAIDGPGRFSRTQPMIDALEQRKSQLFLDLLDRIANGWLRNPKFLRGTKCRLATDHGAEDFKLT